MTDVQIIKHDEMHVRIIADRGIMYEMYEHFSYFVADYKFMPRFKNGTWDGKIRLLNIKTNLIYLGLVTDVKNFCKEYDYSCEVDERLGRRNDLDDVKAFIRSFSSLCKFEPRDYQLAAFVAAIVEQKTLILSPTGSGKSLIIYMIAQYMRTITDKRILLVVPTTGLVSQMHSDFADYDPTGEIHGQCHEIMSGKSKQTDLPIVISTWQSIFKMPADWFSQFDAVIIDEAHQADATSLTGILEKCTTVPYRVGLTGTLKGTRTNEMFMRGIFGKLIKTTTTRKLMDEGTLSDLNIDVYRIKYSQEERKLVSKLKTYQDEIKFITTHPARNKFLIDLAMSQTNNTLLLFNFVEGHGEKLFEIAKVIAERNGKQLYIVHGGTPVAERERIRHLVELHNNILIFASYAVFSTGVNMKNLHTVMFAHPFKSRTRNLQSIGRGLRTSSGKTAALLVDICDDLQYNKKLNNTMNHSIERLKTYESEQFRYNIKDIEFDDSFATAVHG